MLKFLANVLFCCFKKQITKSLDDDSLDEIPDLVFPLEFENPYPNPNDQNLAWRDEALKSNNPIERHNAISKYNLETIRESNLVFFK